MYIITIPKYRILTSCILIWFPDVNECQFNPCENNGTCINNNGSYTCNCTDGWQDKDCKKGLYTFYTIKLDIRKSTYTLNHVIYLIFYFSSHLQFSDVNECQFNPCENNGTCINNNGSYTCNCTDGWQDKDCKKGLYTFYIIKLIKLNIRKSTYAGNHYIYLIFYFITWITLT